MRSSALSYVAALALLAPACVQKDGAGSKNSGEPNTSTNPEPVKESAGEETVSGRYLKSLGLALQDAKVPASDIEAGTKAANDFIAAKGSAGLLQESVDFDEPEAIPLVLDAFCDPIPDASMDEVMNGALKARAETLANAPAPTMEEFAVLVAIVSKDVGSPTALEAVGGVAFASFPVDAPSAEQMELVFDAYMSGFDPEAFLKADAGFDLETSYAAMTAAALECWSANLPDDPAAAGLDKQVDAAGFLVKLSLEAPQFEGFDFGSYVQQYGEDSAAALKGQADALQTDLAEEFSASVQVALAVQFKDDAAKFADFSTAFDTAFYTAASAAGELSPSEIEAAQAEADKVYAAEIAAIDPAIDVAQLDAAQSNQVAETCAAAGLPVLEDGSGCNFVDAYKAPEPPSGVTCLANQYFDPALNQCTDSPASTTSASFVLKACSVVAGLSQEDLAEYAITFYQQIDPEVFCTLGSAEEACPASLAIGTSPISLVQEGTSCKRQSTTMTAPTSP